MNKHQKRVVETINIYLANNMIDTAARSLSALIRCAMTNKSKNELWELASKLNLTNHPDFIA
jgi:hypothetical protein